MHFGRECLGVGTEMLQHAIACDIMNSGDPLRLVLDTDVLVASLRSDQGASRRLLMGALDGLFEVLASAATRCLEGDYRI
jgi:fructose-1,6-bisphosphatase/sedoheptulose 1,7-bisphosphatase-like protein